MRRGKFLVIFIFLTFISYILTAASTQKLVVLTVTEFGNFTDHLDRYLRSGRLNQLHVKVLSSDTPLNFSKSIQLLRNELSESTYEDHQIILFTPSRDVLLLGQAEQILDQFSKSKVKLLLSSEFKVVLCPKKELSKNNSGSRLLSRFIGYKSKIVDFFQQLDKDSDHFIQICDPKNENFSQVNFDWNFKLFHTLNGLDSSVEFVHGVNGSFLRDEVSKEKVLIIHGGDVRGQVTLNYYSNYLLDWTQKDGCKVCKENVITLENIQDAKLPLVTIGIFISKATPFLEEFLSKVKNLEYPKKRINLFLYNNVTYHNKLVSDYLVSKSDGYAQVKTISPDDLIYDEGEARNLAVDFAREMSSDYFFYLESTAHLDNPKTLRRLIEQNRGIVAPLLRRLNKLTSNFWTASDLKGFYDKSKAYVQILKGKWRGLWNVECISSAYLVNRNILHHEVHQLNYSTNIQNSDWGFCRRNRQMGIFMYVSNREDWGHLVSPDGFEEKVTYRVRSELVEFFNNQKDWEDRYIHPDWLKALAEASPHSPQVCPDVYTFPIMTPRFCQDMIEELEHYGNWSQADDHDYDPAPTRHIGLDMIGFEEQWHYFIKLYIQPLQEKIYPGYRNRPLKIGVPFVIRYHDWRIDGRRILNAHHDKSIYTVNIALNTPGKDFEGGGVYFTRYRCKATKTLPGFLLVHPGQLTHQHRGLTVDSGIRYVLISFVDPH